MDIPLPGESDPGLSKRSGETSPESIPLPSSRDINLLPSENSNSNAFPPSPLPPSPLPPLPPPSSDQDTNRYSPSRVTADDESTREDQQQDSEQAQTPSPQPSKGPRTTVLGKAQAKKRLLAFSMTKQGGGQGLSFGFNKKAANKMSSGNPTQFSGPPPEEEPSESREKEDNMPVAVLVASPAKKKASSKKTVTREDKARAVVSAIEEIKREELLMRGVLGYNTVQLLPPPGEMTVPLPLPLPLAPPTPIIQPVKPKDELEMSNILSEQQKGAIESLLDSLLTHDSDKKAKEEEKERRKAEERRKREVEKGTHSKERRRSSKERSSGRSSGREREEKKRKLRELPRSWQQLRESGYKLDEIRRLKLKLEKDKLAGGSSSERHKGRRSRDREHRSRSHEKRHKSSSTEEEKEREKASTESNYDIMSRPFESTPRLIFPFVAAGIRQMQKQYPRSLIRYTKEPPPISYCENPLTSKAFYRTRSEILREASPRVIELMQCIIDGEPLKYFKVEKNRKPETNPNLSSLAALQVSYDETEIDENMSSSDDMNGGRRERCWYLQENLVIWPDRDGPGEIVCSESELSVKKEKEESSDGESFRQKRENSVEVKEEKESDLTKYISSERERERDREVEGTDILAGPNVAVMSGERTTVRSKWDSDYEEDKACMDDMNIESTNAPVASAEPKPEHWNKVETDMDFNLAKAEDEEHKEEAEPKAESDSDEGSDSSSSSSSSGSSSSGSSSSDSSSAHESNTEDSVPAPEAVCAENASIEAQKEPEPKKEELKENEVSPIPRENIATPETVNVNVQVQESAKASAQPENSVDGSADMKLASEYEEFMKAVSFNAPTSGEKQEAPKHQEYRERVVVVPVAEPEKMAAPPCKTKEEERRNSVEGDSEASHDRMDIEPACVKDTERLKKLSEAKVHLKPKLMTSSASEEELVITKDEKQKRSKGRSDKNETEKDSSQSKKSKKQKSSSSSSSSSTESSEDESEEEEEEEEEEEVKEKRKSKSRKSVKKKRKKVIRNKKKRKKISKKRQVESSSSSDSDSSSNKDSSSSTSSSEEEVVKKKGKHKDKSRKRAKSSSSEESEESSSDEQSSDDRSSRKRKRKRSRKPVKKRFGRKKKYMRKKSDSSESESNNKSKHKSSRHKNSSRKEATSSKSSEIAKSEAEDSNDTHSISESNTEQGKKSRKLRKDLDTEQQSSEKKHTSKVDKQRLRSASRDNVKEREKDKKKDLKKKSSSSAKRSNNYADTDTSDEGDRKAVKKRRRERRSRTISPVASSNKKRRRSPSTSPEHSPTPQRRSSMEGKSRNRSEGGKERSHSSRRLKNSSSGSSKRSHKQKDPGSSEDTDSKEGDKHEFRKGKPLQEEDWEEKSASEETCSMSKVEGQGNSEEEDIFLQNIKQRRKDKDKMTHRLLRKEDIKEEVLSEAEEEVPSKINENESFMDLGSKTAGNRESSRISLSVEKSGSRNTTTDFHELSSLDGGDFEENLSFMNVKMEPKVTEEVVAGGASSPCGLQMYNPEEPDEREPAKTSMLPGTNPCSADSSQFSQDSRLLEQCGSDMSLDSCKDTDENIIVTASALSSLKFLGNSSEENSEPCNSFDSMSRDSYSSLLRPSKFSLENIPLPPVPKVHEPEKSNKLLCTSVTSQIEFSSASNPERPSFSLSDLAVPPPVKSVKAPGTQKHVISFKLLSPTSRLQTALDTPSKPDIRGDDFAIEGPHEQEPQGAQGSKDRGDSSVPRQQDRASVVEKDPWSLESTVAEVTSSSKVVLDTLDKDTAAQQLVPKERMRKRPSRWGMTTVPEKRKLTDDIFESLSTDAKIEARNPSPIVDMMRSVHNTYFSESMKEAETQQLRSALESSTKVVDQIMKEALNNKIRESGVRRETSLSSDRLSRSSRWGSREFEKEDRKPSRSAERKTDYPEDQWVAENNIPLRRFSLEKALDKEGSDVGGQVIDWEKDLEQHKEEREAPALSSLPPQPARNDRDRLFDYTEEGSSKAAPDWRLEEEWGRHRAEPSKSKTPEKAANQWEETVWQEVCERASSKKGEERQPRGEFSEEPARSDNQGKRGGTERDRRKESERKELHKDSRSEDKRSRQETSKDEAEESRDHHWSNIRMKDYAERKNREREQHEDVETARDDDRRRREYNEWERVSKEKDRIEYQDSGRTHKDYGEQERSSSRVKDRREDQEPWRSEDRKKEYMERERSYVKERSRREGDEQDPRRSDERSRKEFTDREREKVRERRESLEKERKHDERLGREFERGSSSGRSKDRRESAYQEHHKNRKDTDQERNFPRESERVRRDSEDRDMHKNEEQHARDISDWERGGLGFREKRPVESEGSVEGADSLEAQKYPVPAVARERDVSGRSQSSYIERRVAKEREVDRRSQESNKNYPENTFTREHEMEARSREKEHYPEKRREREMEGRNQEKENYSERSFRRDREMERNQEKEKHLEKSFRREQEVEGKIQEKEKHSDKSLRREAMDERSQEKEKHFDKSLRREAMDERSQEKENYPEKSFRKEREMEGRCQEKENYPEMAFTREREMEGRNQEGKIYPERSSRIREVECRNVETEPTVREREIEARKMEVQGGEEQMTAERRGEERRGSEEDSRGEGSAEREQGRSREEQRGVETPHTPQGEEPGWDRPSSKDRDRRERRRERDSERDKRSERRERNRWDRSRRSDRERSRSPCDYRPERREPAGNYWQGGGEWERPERPAKVAQDCECAPSQRLDAIPLPLNRGEDMELSCSPASSPLVGFKRSLADSTISDSELVAGRSEEPPQRLPAVTSPPTQQPFFSQAPTATPPPAVRKSPPHHSPKRISLDDRIELELGVRNTPPLPPPPAQYQAYQQQGPYPYAQFYPHMPPPGHFDNRPEQFAGPPPLYGRPPEEFVGHRPPDLSYPPPGQPPMAMHPPSMGPDGMPTKRRPPLLPTPNIRPLNNWDSPEAFIGTPPPQQMMQPMPQPMPHQMAPQMPPQMVQQMSSHNSRVLQVGNMLQVVPSEGPPPCPPSQSSVLQAGNMLQVIPSELPGPSQVVQVGNVLQVIPGPPSLGPPPLGPPPLLPPQPGPFGVPPPPLPGLKLAQSPQQQAQSLPAPVPSPGPHPSMVPPPAGPSYSPPASPFVMGAMLAAVVTPGVASSLDASGVVPMQADCPIPFLSAVELAQASQAEEAERRRAERARRRLEKEKRRREREKRNQNKIKQATEMIIKKALEQESESFEGATDIDLEEMRLIEEAMQQVPEPEEEDLPQTATPQHIKKKKKVPVEVKPLPPAGKGILVSPGFREKPAGGTAPQRKSVKFADGIRPGEGTSPSAGEDLPSPPPPPRKLPKEKRYKKKKKKKIKVKIIRQVNVEDDDDDEDISPPPPPPGSPPPPPMYPPGTHYPPTYPPGFAYAAAPPFTVIPGVDSSAAPGSTAAAGAIFTPLYHQHHHTTTTTHTTTVQFAPPPPPVNPVPPPPPPGTHVFKREVKSNP